jgi:hypothetical protein
VDRIGSGPPGFSLAGSFLGEPLVVAKKIGVLKNALRALKRTGKVIPAQRLIPAPSIALFDTETAHGENPWFTGRE